MRVVLPCRADLLRRQVLFIALSAIAGAIFWAIGQQINPLTILLYSLMIGNLIMPATDSLHEFYSERPFPANWVFFLAILLLLLAPVYILSSVVVWLLAPPAPQTLGHLLRTGWKFPFLITFVFSVLIFLYRDTRNKLQRRNVELQRSIDLGAERLEAQDQELERAREIQQSLLPREVPQLRGIEVSGVWQPARVVSGDYYDVLRLSEHRLGVCIADVAGKGVSAALLMANVQAAVRAFAGGSASPAELCGKVNLLLHENIAVGKFVTFLYGILDDEERSFRYCNAGHLYPILARAGSIETPNHGGAVLGVFPGWKYQDSKIDLETGDRLLLFTDGITEAADAQGREFEEKSVAEFAESNRSLSATELKNRLLAKVTAFCGAQFQDDATLLVIAAN
ncbi:MAG: PP2C family protein-serine/threonine phosphatase [Terracidiphilus sp.]